jgi:hypothetical protein
MKYSNVRAVSIVHAHILVVCRIRVLHRFSNPPYDSEHRPATLSRQTAAELPAKTEKPENGFCRRGPPKLHLVRTSTIEPFDMHYLFISNVSRWGNGFDIYLLFYQPLFVLLTFPRGCRNIVAAVAAAHIFAFFFWIYK